MRTLILGLDAFDPNVFERLNGQGRVPHLSKYVERGGYERFTVSNPPQSEVSWTSIATGLNPGGHGIFDFVHRDPASYIPYVSLLPTKRGFGGTKFDHPFTANTIFEHTAQKGYPATALWWPATFPARPESPVRIFPGLGTPDIHGQLGVGTLFTSNDGIKQEKRKTRVERLNREGKLVFTGLLKGPTQKTRKGEKQPVLELRLELNDNKSARLIVDQQAMDLMEGEWSPIVELTFKLGIFVRVHVLTRVILTSTNPDVNLYVLPLQLHPLRSAWPYAAPRGFVKNTWESSGPFLTIGWPQDTIGLEENCIDDDQFLTLCTSIMDTREKVLMYHLQDFKEGVLASVFDSLDRIQHMFWRDRQDIVETWYERLDSLIGRAEQVLNRAGRDKAHVVIVSDHGFANFDHKVHLNRWLIDNGYLTPGDNTDTGKLQDVDWSQSLTYALGLNSLYLNLAGREGQGTVEADRAETLMVKLFDELLGWQGPDGTRVVQNVWRREEVFEGPLSSYGPDILVGYSPGYRGSAQTGLGAWEKESIEPNRDHWGADHCIDPQAVPGVIFSNRGLKDFPNPSYRDFPAITIGEEITPSDYSPPPGLSSDEDQEVLEERLKSLGYL